MNEPKTPADNQNAPMAVASGAGLGHVVWKWTPPPGMNKEIGDDCADEYAVEARESALGGLILWARWGDKWEPNPWSERYVLRQMLIELGKWPNTEFRNAASEASDSKGNVQ